MVDVLDSSVIVLDSSACIATSREISRRPDFWLLLLHIPTHTISLPQQHQQAKHISIIYHLIRRGKLSPLPAMYSKELQALLRRMMARDPAERPSCAELMQDDLLR